MILLWIAAGVGIGIITGLTPGLHVNAMVAIMAALTVDPAGGTALLVAAAVTHTFLDFIPATFLGVPDEGTALSVFPAHRLVMRGRGLEAVHHSLYGSFFAALCAVTLLIPVSGLALNLHESGLYRATVILILFGVCALLVLMEARVSPARGAWALVSLLLSGALGIAVLTWDIPLRGLVHTSSPHLPLLTGLFAVPALLMAKGVRIPPQSTEYRANFSASSASRGIISGALVSLFPGVSSGVAAAMCSLRKGSEEEYITALGGTNTANAIFTSFLVLVTSAPRSGVAQYIYTKTSTGTLYPLSPMAPWIALSALTAALACLVITMPVARIFARAVSRVNYRALSRCILVALVCLVALLTGITGVAVMFSAALIGLIPPRMGCARATLMGSIILPTLALYL